MANGLVQDVRRGVSDERNRSDRQEIWERTARFFGRHSDHDARLLCSRPVGCAISRRARIALNSHGAVHTKMGIVDRVNVWITVEQHGESWQAVEVECWYSPSNSHRSTQRRAVR